MVSIARKLSTIEEQRKDQDCLFQRGDTGIKVINPKSFVDSSVGKDVVIINDTYQMIRSVLSYRAIKIGKTRAFVEFPRSNIEVTLLVSSKVG
jgi:hypothetical protein